MSSSSALTIVQNGVSSLGSYLTISMGILVPAVIAIAALFAGIVVLKSLWHRFF